MQFIYGMVVMAGFIVAMFGFWIAGDTQPNHTTVVPPNCPVYVHNLNKYHGR